MEPSERVQELLGQISSQLRRRRGGSRTGVREGPHVEGALRGNKS